jgi:hypothetical protein
MLLLADMGVPMIAVIWPAAWVALIPVILIETAIGRRILQTTFQRPLCAAVAANLSSAALGIPLTWMVLALLQALLGFGVDKGLGSPAMVLYAVTAQAPWLMPNEEALIWMIPAATAVLCIPLWLVSAASEYLIVRWFFPAATSRSLWRWMLIGNAASYALLWLIVVVTPVLDPLVTPLLGPLVRWVSAVASPVGEFLIELFFKVASLLDPSGAS